jgi:hypothetical protein
MKNPATARLLCSLLLSLGLAMIGDARAQGTCGVTWPCTDPRGCPDFHVAAQDMTTYTTIYDGIYSFSATDCPYLNGWVSGTGPRELLVFSTRIVNWGPGAFEIGSRFDHPDFFTANTCHDHYHLKDMVVYRLWTVEGYQRWSAARAANPDACGDDVMAADPSLASGLIVGGGKLGFCMTDFSKISKKRDGYACPSKHIDHEVYVDCDVQGQGVCHAETYPPGVMGQWLDVTGGLMPDGDYVLENEVNPLHRYAEADLANNRTAILIRRTGIVIQPLAVLAGP